MVRVDHYNQSDRNSQGCAKLVAAVVILYAVSECLGAEKSPTEPRQEEGRLVTALRDYQTNISPKIKEKHGDVCRFTLPCSQYAIDAIEKHGIVSRDF